MPLMLQMLLQDVFHLYMFALCLQILIHIPYFVKAAYFKQSVRNIVRRVLDMILYSAPVAIPSVLLMTGQIGHARLARSNISLQMPEALEMGGLADVVCFDKTGTLTHSVVRHIRSPQW